MIWEARLAFILFFFVCWCVVGLVPWVVSAVLVKGRGSLTALPLALSGAAAAGVLVPALGERDFAGFLISLFTAALGGTAGSIAGIAFYRRLRVAHPAPAHPTVSHAIGGRRPDPPPTSKQP